MPSTCRPAGFRQFAGAAVIGFSLLLAWPGAAVAAYGPPPPPAAPVPGGFSEVVTSQTVGDSGDDITHLDLDGLDGSLVIRPGTFLTPVQVTVTEPFLKESISTTAYSTTAGPALPGECGTGTGIGDAGFRGYCAVGGAGIIVQINGVDDTARFLKPMVLTFDWKPMISDLVVRWTGRHFVIVKNAITRGHEARVQIRRASDYLVLRRMPTVDRPALSGLLGLMAQWVQELSAEVSALSH